MKTIKNLTFTQDQYQRVLNQQYRSGGEAIITLGDQPNTCYKLFQETKTKENSMSDNKLRKIEELYRRNILYLVKPLRTISYNGRIIGYEMTYDKDDKSLSELQLSRKQLIRVLKQTRDILLYFDSQDITYGDVTANNILINTKTGKITFCDIDNIRLGINGIDIKGYCLSRYYTKTGIIDRRADAYMHNILSIKQLAYPTEYESEIIRKLSEQDYPTKFKQPAKEVFASMAAPETFTGEYVIQYIKR